DPVAHVLIAAALRPAPVAAARVDARGAAERHADLDGGDRSGAPRARRGPERPGVLPALPGHRYLEPHRPVDERRNSLGRPRPRTRTRTRRRPRLSARFANEDGDEDEYEDE